MSIASQLQWMGNDCRLRHSQAGFFLLTNPGQALSGPGLVPRGGSSSAPSPAMTCVQPGASPGPGGLTVGLWDLGLSNGVGSEPQPSPRDEAFPSL